MTGSGGWSYFAATRYILGVRPRFGGLLVDPCVPADWEGFQMTRVWRGAEYRITVKNPDGLLPAQPAGSVNEVTVVMGRSERE